MEDNKMKKQITGAALALGLGSSAYAGAQKAVETPAFSDDLSFLKSNQKIARIEFYDENGKRIDPKDMPGLPPVPAFTFSPTPVPSNTATPVPTPEPTQSPAQQRTPVPKSGPKPVADFGYRDNLFRIAGSVGRETSNNRTRSQSSTDYGLDLGLRTRLFTGKDGIVCLDGEVSNVGGSGDYARKQLVNLSGELSWFPSDLYIGPVAGFTFNNKELRDIDLGQNYVGGVSERMKGGKLGLRYLADDLEAEAYWANQFGDVEYSLDQNGAFVDSRVVASSRPEVGLAARLNLGGVEVSTDHVWCRGNNNGVKSRQHGVGFSLDPGKRGGAVFGIEYSKSKSANSGASGNHIEAQITYRGKGKSRRNR
jgi:hypothetical protein